MPTLREDNVAVEAAADLLAQGLSRSDISSLTDLVSDTTVVMAPARPTSRGKAVIEFWRNLSMRHEGIRLLSTDLASLADGVVRDIGTLSMRPKQGDRLYFRYMILWQKVGQNWTLASMTWNRDVQTTARPQRGGQQARGAKPDDGGLGEM